jgi:hypothetical protein
MSVVPVDKPPGVASTAAERQGLWHRLAQALDRHLVDRSKRAIPATTLRRSELDIDRCRRLMHKNAFKHVLTPAGAGLGGMSHRRVVGVPR